MMMIGFGSDTLIDTHELNDYLAFFSLQFD